MAGRRFTPDPEDADFDTVLQEALEVVRELGLAGPDADPDQAREVLDMARDWALRETVVRSRPPRDIVSATPQPDTRQPNAAPRPGTSVNFTYHVLTDIGVTVVTEKVAWARPLGVDPLRAD